VHVQRLVSVVKMGSVLEEYTTEEQCSVMRLWRVNGLNAKDIHKYIFPAYGGKSLSRKAVHNYVDISSKSFADDGRG
jgi:hypothetical protein